MEKSEAQQRAINLGKLLVNELQLETSVDTLGRWMAHYLAIKMSEVENAIGIEKIELEKECFDIILRIWNHRWKLSGNAKPFRNFEPIFEFLVKLNPERQRPYYFDNFLEDKNIEITKKPSNSDVWLKIAKDVDKYARICINQALHNTALGLSTAEQEEWLQNAPRLTEDIDVKIIKYVLYNEKDFDMIDSTEESKGDLMKNIEIEKLKSNIDFLQNFQKVHSKLLKDLKQKLADVV
ncbi:MAG: hypothetical protein B7Y83_04285 [Flavobacteriales bacterium 32-34-25]|nr:MAG: hypothetical protein B7Y83_04285 [Flavobacteriales bacterium 32-34-25]